MRGERRDRYLRGRGRGRGGGENVVGEYGVECLDCLLRVEQGGGWVGFRVLAKIIGKEWGRRWRRKRYRNILEEGGSEG